MEVPKTKTKGRRKMEMKKLENEKRRLVTFTKRRKGLFNKACELSNCCGAKIAVVVFSKSGKPYSCGDVDSVFDQYLTGNVPDDERVSLEEEEGKKLVEEEETGFWWEKTVEETILGMLEEYEKAMKELKKNVEAKLEEVRRKKAEAKASSSSNNPDHNLDVIVSVDDKFIRHDDQSYGENSVNYFDYGGFGLSGGGCRDGLFFN